MCILYALNYVAKSISQEFNIFLLNITSNENTKMGMERVSSMGRQVRTLERLGQSQSECAFTSAIAWRIFFKNSKFSTL